MTHGTINASERIGDDLISVAGPMFVINLPHRQDRRRQFNQQLRHIGLSLTTPNVHLFKAIRPDDPADFPTLGARGCYLSHLNLLKAAYDAGHTSIIICEDDLDFVPNIAQVLPAITQELANQPWDIFYGGHDGKVQGPRLSQSLIQPNSDHTIVCAHFYAIRGQAIPDLIAYLEQILLRPEGHPDGGPMHVDGAISRFRADNPHYSTLAASPCIGVQRPSRTDIHDLRWFDRWPVIRTASNLSRALLWPLKNKFAQGSSS